MKRKSLPSGVSSFLASVMAILLGMLVGLIILVASNPAQAGQGFTAILLGGLSNLKNMGQVLYYATPLIMTGLSVGFASKTGLFNIGASGQFIVGAFAAVFVGVRFTFFTGCSSLDRSSFSSDSGWCFMGNGSWYFKSNKKRKCGNWMYHDELYWNVFCECSGECVHL